MPSLFWVDPEKFSNLLMEVSKDPHPSMSTSSASPAQTVSPVQTVSPARTVSPAQTVERKAESKPGTETEDLATATANITPASLPEEKVPTPFDMPTGMIDQRMEALLNWLRETIPSKEAFLADADGLPLVQIGSELPWVVAGSSLSQAWRNLQDQLTLAPHDGLIVPREKDFLYILSQSSSYGWLTLGFVAETPIAEGTLKLIRNALNLLLEEGKEGDQP